MAVCMCVCLIPFGKGRPGCSCIVHCVHLLCFALMFSSLRMIHVLSIGGAGERGRETEDAGGAEEKNGGQSKCSRHTVPLSLWRGQNILLYYCIHKVLSTYIRIGITVEKDRPE